MHPLHAFLRPRPLRLHAALALVLALASMAAGAWCAGQSRAELAQARAELAAARADPAPVARQRPASSLATALAQRLPGPAGLDQALAQLTRHGPAGRIQVRSVSVQPPPERSGPLQRHQFTLALSADYPAFKAWLGELLERQQGLAVQALSLQRSTNAPPDIQLALVLYTWRAR